MSTTVPAFTEANLGRSQRHTVIRIPLVVATGSIAASISYLDTTETPQILWDGGIGAGTLTTLTQANIDSLLGSTNEVVASAAFGSTAMASGNTIGFVLNCGGQIDHVDHVRVLGTVAAGGSATTVVGKGTSTALTNVAITDPQVYVTASGNLAGRVNISQISSGTSAGYCIWEIHSVLK